MSKKTIVVAVVNQKGGTGKTTTCENLGVALAKEGKNVLLVDTDPQSSLTEGFCSSVAQEAKYNLADIMNGIMNGKPVNSQETILHHSQGIDVVISSVELSGVEFDLINVKNREKILGIYLDDVKSNYDYVLLDCNPSLGVLPINALAAANEVLIPVQSHFADAKGMEHLLRSINRVQLKMNPKLKISGILLTMVEPRTNYAKSVSETIRNVYGAKIKVFESSIPRSIRAAETGGTSMSIFEHDPKGKVAEAYRKLAKEVIESGEKKHQRNIEQLR